MLHARVRVSSTTSARVTPGSLRLDTHTHTDASHTHTQGHTHTHTSPHVVSSRCSRSSSTAVCRGGHQLCRGVCACVCVTLATYASSPGLDRTSATAPPPGLRRRHVLGIEALRTFPGTAHTPAPSRASTARQTRRVEGAKRHLGGGTTCRTRGRVDSTMLKFGAIWDDHGSTAIAVPPRLAKRAKPNGMCHAMIQKARR